MVAEVGSQAYYREAAILQLRQFNYENAFRLVQLALYYEPEKT